MKRAASCLPRRDYGEFRQNRQPETREKMKFRQNRQPPPLPILKFRQNRQLETPVNIKFRQNRQPSSPLASQESGRVCGCQKMKFRQNRQLSPACAPKSSALASSRLTPSLSSHARNTSSSGAAWGRTTPLCWTPCTPRIAASLNIGATPPPSSR